MKFIIELRRNGVLEKNGTTYYQIKENNEKLYVKTLDLYTGQTAEYTDIEKFNAEYYDGEKVYIPYTYTDIKFIQQLKYKERRCDFKCLEVFNSYYEKQDYTYVITHIDATTFGLTYNIMQETGSLYKENKSEDKYSNIAKLILTSSLPIEKFLSLETVWTEYQECIVLPTGRWATSPSHYWKIQDKDKFDDIIAQVNKNKIA